MWMSYLAVLLPPPPPTPLPVCRVEMKGQLANLPARQPANTPPPPYGVERGDSSSANTCLGSATTTIASPCLDPAASRMLEQYLACVAACGWGRVVFETRAGRERFDFSCRPPNDISDTPIPSRARTQGSRRTADLRDAKRQTSAHKREREKRRRTAWAKEHEKCAKAASGPALADWGATAATAAAPTAAAAAATATAATAASRKGAQQLLKLHQRPEQQLRPPFARPQWRRCLQLQLLEPQPRQQRGARALLPGRTWSLWRTVRGRYEPVPACPGRQAEAEAPTAGRADKRTERSRG